MQTLGETYLNDKDILPTYGASLIGESLQNLILRADPKDRVEVDMISHPGIQVFDDNPQPKAREVELTFLILGNSLDDFLQKYEAIQDEMDSGNGTFSLRVSPLYTTYILERKSSLSLESFDSGSKGKLVINARELNPKNRIKL